MRLRGLVVLLIVIPVLALAQTPPNPPPVLLSSQDLVAPNGVAHFEEYEIDGHRQLHCTVTSNEGTGELTFDGRTIRFGDGYAIQLTTLARTEGSFVVRLTATGEHGPSATAIIARSLRTGETTAAGVEGFSNALRRSHHAQIVGRVLVALQQVPSLEGGKLQVGGLASRPPIQIAPNDCIKDAIMFISAAAGVWFTCVEAPGLPCILAIINLAGNAYSLWQGDCGGGSYLDNSIGF